MPTWPYATNVQQVPPVGLTADYSKQFHSSKRFTDRKLVSECPNQKGDSRFPSAGKSDFRVSCQTLIRSRFDETIQFPDRHISFPLIPFTIDLNEYVQSRNDGSKQAHYRISTKSYNCCAEKLKSIDFGLKIGSSVAWSHFVRVTIHAALSTVLKC